MDLVWGKAVASTDRWVGALSGAWNGAEDRRLTHLVVGRGFRRRRVSVPVERIDHSDSDGLYLRLSTLEFLVSPADKDRLLGEYWSVAHRQVETSVVLADQRWFDDRQGVAGGA